MSDFRSRNEIFHSEKPFISFRMAYYCILMVDDPLTFKIFSRHQFFSYRKVDDFIRKANYVKINKNVLVVMLLMQNAYIRESNLRSPFIRSESTILLEMEEHYQTQNDGY
ncbi:hypothetical protein RF11_09957 [Thelohanellus kitauei]|uniref:Uncharacterized protein n=1 Tax=Thelohanellus kitauei TaxID=669202 RepID=A0A0C2MXW7_THEKT|nr:hypothetical protein RF11_09957 [Thelohanellus kitauei]